MKMGIRMPASWTTVGRAFNLREVSSPASNEDLRAVIWTDVFKSSTLLAVQYLFNISHYWEVEKSIYSLEN